MRLARYISIMLVIGCTVPAAASANEIMVWMQNGRRMAGNQQVAVIAWGNLIFAPSGQPSVTCQAMMDGYLLNETTYEVPPGSGLVERGARGKVESFSTYNCKAENCPAPGYESITPQNANGEKEGGAIHHNINGEPDYAGYYGIDLSWPLSLELSGRFKPSNMRLDIDCRNAEGAPVTETKCEADELLPKMNDGSGIGIHTSKIEYNETAGAMNCEGVSTKVSGSLRMFGYNEQQLLTAQAQ